jgi:uridine phosphorylase
MSARYPILDFDSDRPAVAEPSKVIARNEDMPERCVLCFFQSAIDELISRDQVTLITHLRSEMGQHPVYLLKNTEPAVALFQPGIGAPLSAALFEELIALGGRKFIACGIAAVLDSSIASGQLMVPVEAVRDEGTSYHYISPGKAVKPSARALQAIKATLTSAKASFRELKTWTTDGIYRETRKKIDKRKNGGCSCVDMEASALFSVAEFRGVEFGQVLLAADDAGGESWDPRDCFGMGGEREKTLRLAVEACKQI